MDTVASARIAGASPVLFTPLVGETIANLDVLEAAVKHAQAPLIPTTTLHTKLRLFVTNSDHYSGSSGLASSGGRRDCQQWLRLRALVKQSYQTKVNFRQGSQHGP